MTAEDRVNAVAEFGFTPRQARFLVTVMLHSFYDGPGLLAAIHATAALGGSQAMVEWREFDLEAQIYGGALAPNWPGR